jgi:uncharacterized protein (DUF885 family)
MKPNPKRRQALQAATMLALTPVFSHLRAATPSNPEAFNAWSDRFAADWVRLSPEWASNTQYFSGAEQAALDAELTPQTPAHRQQRTALARAGLAALQGFALAELNDQQRTSAAILRWSLHNTVANAPFEDHSFVFNQGFGAQVRYVSFLAETHPLRRAADLERYLQRLAQVPTRLDESIALANASAQRGLLPPRFILERAREQVRTLLASDAAQSDFVAGLARRSQGTQGLSLEAREAAIARATQLVAGPVFAAYRRVLALLDELHPRTQADAGLWRLPQGEAAYAQALANHTGTPLSADEIHRIGLREVARIEAQMDGLLKAAGYGEGSVTTRMQALRSALQPAAEPDPRPALLALYQTHVQDSVQRAQALFNLQPKAPLDVRRVPALTERTASAYYTTPAPDGSRPGVFWVPMPGPAFDVPKMRSLAVHEAVPGHHFQLALQQEQADLPRWRQRRIFGGGAAHAEGWALYAERLAIDNGWYEGDPHSLLGALDAQLFRARRLVVDTGLHAKRWSREQAIAYGISAQEVERYVANPGQACAYMLGMLHILDLRAKAQAALGDRFAIKDFHDVVLKTGSVPLAVLSAEVQRWVANPSPAQADEPKR